MKTNKIKYIILMLSCTAIAVFFSFGLKQQQPVEEMNIISGIGQDIEIKDGIVTYIAPFSVYLFGPQEKIESTLITATADSIGETKQVRQLEDDKQSILGLEKIFVLSEETSQYGIRDTIDILFRNQYLNDTAYVMVCKGNASDVLTLNIKGYPSSGDFIEGLIRNSVHFNFFSDNYKMLDLFFTVDSEGRNITLPYIEITKNDIEITGMALFKKDKMVAKINVDELKTMNMLKENNVKGILSIQKNAKEYINYYAPKKKVNISLL